MNEILSSFYQRLRAQVSEAVYDHVPQDTEAYPYCVLRIVETNNDDTDTENSFSAIIQVTAYSRYRGFSELAALADNVTEALNNWEMPDTASYKVGTIKERFRQYTTSPDNLTRYCVQEYVFYYESI